jgi:hypothetical protein
MLYYSIAHYYDVNDKRKNAKYEHILKHINAFLQIDDNKEFIVVSAIDTPRGDERYLKVKNDLNDFCKKYLPDHKIHIIVEYNWGGTIADLWYSYLHIKSNNIDSNCYIAHFEEDFGPINNNWYTESKKLLINDIIYVGESTKGELKHANIKTGQNDDGRIYSQPGGTRLALPEVWTDGGYYFSCLNNLQQIENRIGIFHKGNQNTKYTNLEDGISIGEVGFPTLLHHAGFKFTCIKRSNYFINEWCGGH